VIASSKRPSRRSSQSAEGRLPINDLFRSGKLKDEARREIERELDLREAHLINQQAEE
jgi:hypothetical protein